MMFPSCLKDDSGSAKSSQILHSSLPGSYRSTPAPLSGVTEGLIFPYLDIFLIVFPLCSLAQITCLLYHKRSHFLILRGDSVPSLHGCPFSGEASPCLHRGQGRLHQQPLCAHDPVPTSTTGPWHQDTVMRHALLMCVLGPPTEV